MRRVIALAMGLTIVAAACGSEGGTTTPVGSEGAGTEPVTTDAAAPEPTEAPEPEPTVPPATTTTTPPDTTTTTEPRPPLNVVGLVPLPGTQLDFAAQAVPQPSLVWSLYSGSGGIIVEDVLEPLPNGCHGAAFFDPVTFELLEIGGAGANAYASVGPDGCANMNEPGAEQLIDSTAVAANTGTFIQFDFGELPPPPFDVSTQVLEPGGMDGVFRSADPDAQLVINDLTDATHVIGWSDLFEPDPDTGALRAVPQAETQPGPGCAEITVCLKSGRFQVDVQKSDGTFSEAVASSDDAGLFTFFSPEQIDAYITVLNGCDINDHFWVFAASPTDVEYTLTVTDTATASTREYFRDVGTQPAEPILDTEAFATCP
jgi:hypothetical protein